MALTNGFEKRYYAEVRTLAERASGTNPTSRLNSATSANDPKQISTLHHAELSWDEVVSKVQNVALREPTTRLLHASTPEGGQVKPLTSKESQ